MGITVENLLGKSEVRAHTLGGQSFLRALGRENSHTAEARSGSGGSKFDQWFTTKNAVKAIGVIGALGLTAGLADAISPGVVGGIGRSVHDNLLGPLWNIVKYPFQGMNLTPLRKEAPFQLPNPGAGIDTQLTYGLDDTDIKKELIATDKAYIWAKAGEGGPIYRFIRDLMTKLKVADAKGIAHNVTEFAGGVTTAFTGDILGGYTDYKYSGKLVPVTALVGSVAAMKAVRPIERYKEWADVNEARSAGPMTTQVKQLGRMSDVMAAPALPSPEPAIVPV